MRELTPIQRVIAADAAAVGVGVGLYGVSFGVLAVAAGASTLQAMALSLLVFTGGSQFAFIGVIAGGGSAAAALTPALLLATRNTVYGISVAPLLRGPLAARLLSSHLVIDESTAMARAQTTPDAARIAFLSTGVCVFIFWNLGTLAGALAGAGLGDPRDLGLDAMFPAAFLALLAPQLRRPGAPRVALGGALIAAVLVSLTPVGVPIAAAVLALAPAAVATRRVAGEAAPP